MIVFVFDINYCTVDDDNGGFAGWFITVLIAEPSSLSPVTSVVPVIPIATYLKHRPPVHSSRKQRF